MKTWPVTVKWLIKLHVALLACAPICPQLHKDVQLAIARQKGIPLVVEVLERQERKNAASIYIVAALP